MLIIKTPSGDFELVNPRWIKRVQVSADVSEMTVHLVGEQEAIEVHPEAVRGLATAFQDGLGDVDGNGAITDAIVEMQNKVVDAIESVDIAVTRLERAW